MEISVEVSMNIHLQQLCPNLFKIHFQVTGHESFATQNKLCTMTTKEADGLWKSIQAWQTTDNTRAQLNTKSFDLNQEQNSKKG